MHSDNRQRHIAGEFFKTAELLKVFSTTKSVSHSIDAWANTSETFRASWSSSFSQFVIKTPLAWPPLNPVRLTLEPSIWHYERAWRCWDWSDLCGSYSAASVRAWLSEDRVCLRLRCTSASSPAEGAGRQLSEAAAAERLRTCAGPGGPGDCAAPRQLPAWRGSGCGSSRLYGALRSGRGRPADRAWASSSRLNASAEIPARTKMWLPCCFLRVSEVHEGVKWVVTSCTRRCLPLTEKAGVRVWCRCLGELLLKAACEGKQRNDTLGKWCGCLICLFACFKLLKTFTANFLLQRHKQNSNYMHSAKTSSYTLMSELLSKETQHQRERPPRRAHLSQILLFSF